MTKETETQISEIHATVVKGIPAGYELHRRARAVVDAWYYQGDDGWDRLKNAIAELKGLVGKTETPN